VSLKPLPIGEKPYYNIDAASKHATISDTCFDGYIDESKTVRRRGALKSWIDLETGKPGNGIFYWHQANRLVAVSGGQAWLIDEDGTTTELTGVTLNEQSIVFADGNEIDGSRWLYLADGGYPVYATTGTTLTRLDSTSGAPSACSHVCWTQGRFLANFTNTRKFYATDTNPTSAEMDNAYFLASDNPLTAESRPDNLLYLGVSWEEILVWGTQGLETWRDDGTFFSPVIGAFAPVGILAPYSVAEADNTVFALCTVDNGSKRAVVSMQGRSPQVISLDIEKVLAGYTTVDDAIAWLTKDSEYVITFPSAGATWCYDYRNKVWYPWSKWNGTEAIREEFLGRHSATAWGRTFIQSRIDGKIYEYDRATYQDDGGTLATEYVTGWMGEGEATRMNRLRLKLKLAQGSEAGSEPVMIVRWRDNGDREWKLARQVSLGKQGQYEFYRDLWNLGIFTSRQFSFILTDNAELALVGVEADMTRMTR
jgi:hypothetical protein